MPTTDNDDQDSANLFQEAMHDVKPLKNRHKQLQDQPLSATNPLPKATYQARRIAAEQEEKPGGAALSDAWVEPIEPEQVLSYAQSGVQTSQLRKLQKGAFEVQYALDLHGYKIDEARDTTLEFLRFCQREGFRCVRIVHGKAHRNQDRQSTLKSHVNHWLRQLPHQVLAFCSAPRAVGGSGSVLLLLKRKHA